MKQAFHCGNNDAHTGMSWCVLIKHRLTVDFRTRALLVLDVLCLDPVES